MMMTSDDDDKAITAGGGNDDQTRPEIPVLVQLHSKQLGSSSTDEQENNNNIVRMDQIMEMSSGENWLRLVNRTSNNSNNINGKSQQQQQPSILDDTQDTSLWRQNTQHNHAAVPYPSILAGPMNQDDSCYLMVDVVDDPFSWVGRGGGEEENNMKIIITVKDMRVPPNNSGGSDDDEEDFEEQQQPLFDICLARRLDDTKKNNGEKGLWPGYGPLETLPRRQLRVLQPGDRICTTLCSAATSDHSSNDDGEEEEGDANLGVGLVLEFRMEKPSNVPKHNNMTLPDDTQEATSFSAPLQDDNDDDDDDNTEMEEELKVTVVKKPTSELQIMETSSTEEEDDEEETHEAVPALTQPEGLGQPMDSDEEQEETGANSINNTQEPPSWLATQPPQEGENDDGDDSDATEMEEQDDAEQQQNTTTTTTTTKNEEEKPVTKPEGPEMRTKDATKEEESTEAKTTQETEGSAANNPTMEVKKAVDDGDDSSQETTMSQDEEVDTAASKKMDNVPNAIETTKDDGDDDEATQDFSMKGAAKVDAKSGSGQDQQDGDATQEMAVKGDGATQSVKETKDATPKDKEATQDIAKAAKEVAPVDAHDDDNDDATQDVTKPTEQVPEKDVDATQDMSDDNGVAVVEENKENEDTVTGDSESQVKDKNAAPKKSDGGESQAKSSRKSQRNATKGNASEPTEPADPMKHKSEEETGIESPLRSSRRKSVKKYGKRFNKSVDDTQEAANTADLDSDHSATPQKLPTQKSPEVAEAGDDDNEKDEMPQEVSGNDKEDTAEDAGSPPTTPPKSRPAASPKVNSSQARKEEGASILASIKDDGSSEETSPDNKVATKPKTKKAAARVKRKTLEPVAEKSEDDFDAAVPESNLKSSVPSKGSPDSNSSDPTRKRRAKSRRTDAKTSPTPASVSTPAPKSEPEPAPETTPQAPPPAETPAKITRKRKTTQPASDSKSVPKRTRATPSRAARNVPDEDKEPDEEAEPESGEIRVITTGVTLSKAQIKFITQKLGGTLLEDVADAPLATHIVASDKNVGIKRTPKLMICLCTTGNIVGMDWLVQSSKANKALPTEDYLLLDDKEAEDRYDFSMQESLERAKEMRQKGEHLLSGWRVHVCKGVSGNKAPPEKEMKLIVEVAGGEWQPTLTARSLDGVDLSRLLIITSDPEVKKQVSPKAVASALENGATKHTTSWLFGCIMKQKLEFPEAA